jgi:asparagine synthase (glutamine-hydrolysing)
MRRALSDVLPRAVVERKDKLGYPTPFAQWLRGPLRNEVDAFLHDRVLKRDWYDVETVNRLWRAHTTGWRNLEGLIYRMITAEQWYGQVV